MAEYTKAFASSSLAEYGWHSSNATCSQAIINPTLLKILNAERPTQILDLGCGNGSLCRFLHSHGFTVVGMEPDSGGLDIARQKSPSIPFYQVGVEDDPGLVTESQGLFDAVVSTEVIEHLYLPHLLARFAWRCLKPGGLLIVSTPYHGIFKPCSFACWQVGSSSYSSLAWWPHQIL